MRWSDWGDLTIVCVNHDKLTLAEQAVSAADALTIRHWSGQLDAVDARRDQAYVAFMKARLALAQGHVTESVAWFKHAMMLDTHYQTNPQYLYTHLIDAGAFDAALDLIQTDQENVVRAGFWKGLIHYRMGQKSDAERHWQKVVSTKIPEAWQCGTAGTGAFPLLLGR